MSDALALLVNPSRRTTARKERVNRSKGNLAFDAGGRAGMQGGRLAALSDRNASKSQSRFDLLEKRRKERFAKDISAADNRLQGGWILLIRIRPTSVIRR
jgi:hypothetical protein